MVALWQLNPGLAASARRSLPATASAHAAARDLATLLMLGAVAALATSFLPGGLRIPGHAILRGTLPMVLGMSLVPRRSAGAVMSLAAAGTFAALRLGGLGLPNPAACVGVLCLGPAADLALQGTRPGLWVYVRFAAAGLAANVAAFAVRLATGTTAAAPLAARVRTWAPGSGMGGGNRMGGGGMGMHRGALGALPAAGESIDPSWLVALSSFALCGALAGLVCAAIWFRRRPRQPRGAP